MIKPNIKQRPPLIGGIGGASGAVYGVRLLELLKVYGIETHLIISRAAQTTLTYETDLKVAQVERLAAVVHSYNDIGAACSSGSFKTMGMIVAPCSIKTMSEIATGATGNLIARSADVALKERRRDGGSHRGGCDRLTAGSRFLCAAEIACRHGRSRARPCARPVRYRNWQGSALDGRDVEFARRSQPARRAAGLDGVAKSDLVD